MDDKNDGKKKFKNIIKNRFNVANQARMSDSDMQSDNDNEFDNLEDDDDNEYGEEELNPLPNPDEINLNEPMEEVIQ